MDKVIDMAKVERIWAAEKELQEAIHDAGQSSIQVKIEIVPFQITRALASDHPVVYVSQLISARGN